MNQIVFDVAEYNNDIDAMFTDIGKVIPILVRNGYFAVIRYEDCNIYCLDIAHTDEGLNDKHLMWLTDEEVDEIYAMRRENNT